MGTVEVILSVADADRSRAIQLVLHPEWCTEVLGPREAESVIKSVILEPARKKAAWGKESPGLVKAWKKALGTYLTKEQKKDLIVQAIRYDEDETSKLKTSAEAIIPADRLSATADMSEGIRWVHLALFHGLPVWVRPGSDAEDADQSSAVVDERLIVLAETARADNGMDVTILTGKAERSKKTNDREQRIDSAVAELDGEGDPHHDVEEAPEKVIAQRMESRAWVDLGPVRLLRERIKPLQWPADEVPEDSPDWLTAIWDGQCGAEEIVALCDWILGLMK
ncbi:MAG: hypothetical protein WCO57_16785, partial [Verrucomicrobiota bacterium]